MMTPFLPEWLALSRHIGEALQCTNDDITLTSGALNGSLLSWFDERSGTVLLTAEDAWLDWVADLAPALRPGDYSAEVLHAMTEWTFKPIAHLLSNHRFNARWFTQRTAPPSSGLMLRLKRGDRQLAILLQIADWSFLHGAVRDWLPTTADAVAEIPLSLMIGQSELTTVVCRQLTSGMGLVLQQTPDLDGSELWLTLGSHCAGATLLPDGQLLLNTEFYHRPPSSRAPDEGEYIMNDIPLTLTAEIGQVAITLGELQQLRSGDVLTSLANLDERVQLKVNGYTVASGELIQAENGWLVRICQRPASAAASDGEPDAWTR